MPTTLQVRFGHEENFSRYLLESGQFEQLLARAGFAVAGEGALEVPVAKGHEGREGRLDIYQPTTAGVVIGEMRMTFRLLVKRARKIAARIHHDHDADFQRRCAIFDLNGRK